MKPKPVMITIDARGRWSVADGTAVETISVADDASPTVVAAALTTTLSARGYRGAGLMLAVPGSWCLSAAVSTEGLPRRTHRQRALLYRFEEKLPVAAEDVVADFVEREDKALGVAALSERLQPWIVALEAEGIAIESVAPTAMLATQAFVEELLTAGLEEKGSDEPPSPRAKVGSGESRPADRTAVLWKDGSILELVLLERGRPAAWQVVSSIEEAAASLRIHAHRCANSLSVLINPGDTELAMAAGTLPGVSVSALPIGDAARAAAVAAEAAGRGELDLWFNLRRDALAAADPLRQVRRPLRATLGLAAAFLVLLSAGMLWRAYRYESLAEELAQEQRAVFRQTLPGQAVPAAVRSRLASEEQRLRGLSGDGRAVGAGPSSLLVLRDALGRLPGELRFRLLEVRIDGERLYIEGQARSHSDADLIAASLRRQQGFDVEPPRTEQLAGQGVSFTITGTVARPPALAQGGPP